MNTFVLAFVGLTISAVTLPVTTELALLTTAFLLRRRGRHSVDSPAKLALTVIVPAHNEELLIGRTVTSLRDSIASSYAPGSTRILVIAHNCSDQTAERAAAAGAEVLIFNDPAAKGKGFALRYAFDHSFSAGADAALVVDADSTVSNNLIQAVQDAFSRGTEAVQCCYEMASTDESARRKIAALALRGFNLIRPAGRNRLGFSSGILGNGFAVSRSTFATIPYGALSIVEDLEYHIHLVIAGKRVEFLEEARVFSELPTSSAGESSQRSRWEGGRFHAARKWLLPLAGRIARGRLRLLEPFLDLAGLPLAYATLLLLIALVFPAPWLRAYALAALAVIGFHVLVAAKAGGRFWSDLEVLCAVPAYVVWKLRMVPRLLRESSSNAIWVRTERTSTPPKLHL